MNRKARIFFSGAVIGTVVGGFLVYVYFVSTTFSGFAEKMIGTVGGLTAIIAACAYFCKTYVEHQLGIAAEQNKITFANLYKMRTDTLTGVYQRLIGVRQAIDVILLFVDTPDLTRQGKRILLEKAENKWRDFESFYELNKFCLAQGTTGKIDTFANVVGQLLQSYGLSVSLEHAATELQRQVSAEEKVKLKELSAKIPSTFSALVVELQTVFQFPLDEINTT